ncbi:MAG: hypothetical protein J6S41_05915, partial [Clostridia bacterium]|nr:hypothetical protein [Clostridia bacterium]
TATRWWLRSPLTGNNSNAFLVGTNGYFSGDGCSKSYGVRPALILPDNMGVDDSGNITEQTAQILHGSMINNVLCVTKKCYAMIDGVLCAVPYGLANIDGVMTKIQFEEPEPPAPPVQMYTVTIGTETPGYGYPGVVYFKINGTEYTGASTKTLTVNEGTAWYAQIGSGSGQIFVNGKNVSKLSTEGTVTSNMTVTINGYTIPGQTIPVHQIYITT